MKRKYIYTLLALPVLVIAVVLLLTPKSTLAIFFSEFKHRSGSMMGNEPEKVGDGSRGLRLERPEEYGPQPGGPEEADEDADEQEEGQETVSSE